MKKDLMELRLKREVKNAIFRSFWFNASYHSDFIRRLGYEPIIPNYNVFEKLLIEQAKIISGYDRLMSFIDFYGFMYGL